MRQWPRRFAATIWEDPTRQVQTLCVLAAFLAAYWLLSYRTPADASTARAVFYFLSETHFALILLGAGALQLLAVGGPSWRVRAVAAVVKLIVWAYAAGCFWLTNANALASAFLPVFVLAEFWVAYRAIHDRDINGTDRRNDGLRNEASYE
jgi:hypothetical protein